MKTEGIFKVTMQNKFHDPVHFLLAADSAEEAVDKAFAEPGLDAFFTDKPLASAQPVDAFDRRRVPWLHELLGTKKPEADTDTSNV